MGIAYGPVAKRMWNLGAGSHPYTVAIFASFLFMFWIFVWRYLRKIARWVEILDRKGPNLAKQIRGKMQKAIEARLQGAALRCALRCVNRWDNPGDGSKPWYLVNPKIAGKWMFIPLKMYLSAIDPYPSISSQPGYPKRAMELSRHVAREIGWNHPNGGILYMIQPQRGYKPTTTGT